jgi:release factor glutamine methyltransferase
MTFRELLAEGETALNAGPHPERARLDAETLLLHVLKQDPAWLMAHGDDAAGEDAAYWSLIARRVAGEPIQYITGSSEFFGLPFSVGPGVLIPRPETEHLVEEVIRLAGLLGDQELHIADLGTGSGIIAVALADALPSAHIAAVDLSSPALVIARENAERNQVAGRIEFFEGDFLAPLAGRSFSIIASNPPYVPLLDRDSLSVEVREHEPHAALFAGEDGLDVYRRLVPEAREYLLPGGWLVMEIGYGQRDAVDAMLQSHGYGEVHFVADYQGIPRVAAGQVSHLGGDFAKDQASTST